jgi:hypothetical protein
MKGIQWLKKHSNSKSYVKVMAFKVWGWMKKIRPTYGRNFPFG